MKLWITYTVELNFFYYVKKLTNAAQRSSHPTCGKIGHWIRLSSELSLIGKPLAPNIGKNMGGNVTPGIDGGYRICTIIGDSIARPGCTRFQAPSWVDWLASPGTACAAGDLRVATPRGHILVQMIIDYNEMVHSDISQSCDFSQLAFVQNAQFILLFQHLKVKKLYLCYLTPNAAQARLVTKFLQYELSITCWTLAYAHLPAQNLASYKTDIVADLWIWW